jgi:hypothetical protein
MKKLMGICCLLDFKSRSNTGQSPPVAIVDLVKVEDLGAHKEARLLATGDCVKDPPKGVFVTEVLTKLAAYYRLLS